VSGGVVEQVGQELVQARPVGVHVQVLGLDPDVVGDRPRSRADLGDHLLHQVDHRHVGAVQRHHAGVDAGEVEEVTDERAQPLRLPEGGPDRLGVRVGHAVVEVLQHCDHRRQRRAQLVGDARDQLPPLPVDRGEVGGHPVERPRQLADLVGR
jgi:hypothetical protein